MRFIVSLRGALRASRMLSMKRIGVVAILLVAFLGLADSAYLAQNEANGTPLLCNIQNLSGCNVVAQSSYSHLFGIPVAEFGILFYGALFVLAAFELVIFDRILRRALQVAGALGVLFSAYSVLLQLFVIQALCVYCLASAFFAFVVFLLAYLIEPIRRSAWDRAPGRIGGSPPVS